MAREALERIREEGGEEGFTLANTLIRTFGGVGKGIDDRRVVLRLADEVEAGHIRLQGRVFVYRNSRGRDMVFGAQGDTLLDEVVGIAAGIHGDIAKKRRLDPIEDTEVRSGILSAVRQVSYELDRRARVKKVKSWIRNTLGLS